MVEKPQNENDAEHVAEVEESPAESSDDPATDVNRDDGDSEASSETTRTPHKKSITLIRDDDDEEFMLPWDECKTWEVRC